MIVRFEIGHPEKDHLCHVAGRILHFHRRDGKEDEKLDRLQGHLLLIRILEDPGDLILIVIEPFLHKGLGFGHFPDAVEEVIENDRRTEKFLSRPLQERRDPSFPISFQPVMDEVDDPSMFGEEGSKPVEKGNGCGMDGIEPEEISLPRRETKENNA